MICSNTLKILYPLIQLLHFQKEVQSKKIIPNLETKLREHSVLDSLVPLIPGHFAHCIQTILVILSPLWQQAQEDDNCVFITSSEWPHVTPSSYLYSVEL